MCISAIPHIPGKCAGMPPPLEPVSSMSSWNWAPAPVAVKVLNQNGVQLPVYQSAGASGADLVAAESTYIQSGETAIVGTGLYIVLPEGYEAQIRSRSGLAAKNGVFVLNSPGTIDSDYRGEIKVILANLGNGPFTVTPGMRIAQLVISPVTRGIFEFTNELPTTKRGEGGLGSTGT